MCKSSCGDRGPNYPPLQLEDVGMRDSWYQLDTRLLKWGSIYYLCVAGMRVCIVESSSFAIDVGLR